MEAKKKIYGRKREGTMGARFFRERRRCSEAIQGRFEESLKLTIAIFELQSSAPLTPRKSWENKVVASVNSPPSSKSDSSSPKTPSPSMPPRSRTAVSLLLLSVRA